MVQYETMEGEQMTIDLNKVNATELIKTKTYFDRENKTKEILVKAQSLQELEHVDVHTITVGFGAVKAYDTNTATQKAIEEETNSTTEEFLKEVIEPMAKIYNEFLEKHPDYTASNVYSEGYTSDAISWIKTQHISDRIHELCS